MRRVLFPVVLACLLLASVAAPVRAAIPIAYLEIPAIGVEAPIYRAPRTGRSWDIDVCGDDVAYLYREGQTAIVLAGHSTGALARLPQATEGDRATLVLGDGWRWVYEIMLTGTVDKYDMSIFDARRGVPANLVIITCTTLGDDWRWAAFAWFLEAESDEWR